MVTRLDPRLGCLKDKHKDKDWLFTVAKPAAVRDLINLAKYLPPRIDQGQIGSCTGAGYVTYAAGVAILKGVSDLIPVRKRFSIWWAYNWARYIEGTLSEDSGAYLRDILDAMRKNGTLPDYPWPYKDGETKLDKTSPPSKFLPEAAKWPLESYKDIPQLKGFYRITGGAEGLFQALEAALQTIESGSPQHLFLYMGVPWYDNWMKTDKNGFLPMPSSKNYVVGGHCTDIYAGNYKEGWFGLVNSWGKSWGTYPVGTTTGEKGCCKVQAEIVDRWKKDGGYDAYVIIFEGGNWGSQPTPTPTSQTIIRLQKSVDAGTTWTPLYEGAV